MCELLQAWLLADLLGSEAGTIQLMQCIDKKLTGFAGISQLIIR